LGRRSHFDGIEKNVGGRQDPRRHVGNEQYGDFINTETRRIVANVLVDARPRFAEFKRDASEVWVSSEIGGTVSVINPVKHEVKKKISFDIPGLRKEAIQVVRVSGGESAAGPRLFGRCARLFNGYAEFKDGAAGHIRARRELSAEPFHD
jgi:hypothetical protein